MQAYTISHHYAPLEAPVPHPYGSCTDGTPGASRAVVSCLSVNIIVV